jgi:flagellar biosynthetic protein FliR
MTLIPFLESQVPLFLVILARIAGILAAIPGIGARTVPARVRIGLVLGLTLILLPVVGSRVNPLGVALPHLLPLAFTEFMVGMVLGMSIQFVLAAIEMAGELVGIQMGLNLIGVLDPIAGAQIPVLGEFMSVLASLVFFAIDGHHVVLEALVSSFQLVPPLGVHLSGAVVEGVLNLAVGMFVLALKVGAPIMTALFIVTFGIGMLGRTIPQFNVLINTIPVTIVVGMLVLGVSLPLFGKVVLTSFGEIGPTLNGLLLLMGEGR